MKGNFVKIATISGSIALVASGLFFAPDKGPVPVDEVKSTPSYYAEVDAEGNVLRVIVADKSFIESGAVGPSSNWLRGDKKGNIRRNGVAPGYKYNATIDAFVPPAKPGQVLFDEQEARWKYPTSSWDDIGPSH